MENCARSCFLGQPQEKAPSLQGGIVPIFFNDDSWVCIEMKIQQSIDKGHDVNGDAHGRMCIMSMKIVIAVIRRWDIDTKIHSYLIYVTVASRQSISSAVCHVSR